jgi:hypothetical protein
MAAISSASPVERTLQRPSCAITRRLRLRLLALPGLSWITLVIGLLIVYAGHSSLQSSRPRVAMGRHNVKFRGVVFPGAMRTQPSLVVELYNAYRSDADDIYTVTIDKSSVITPRLLAALAKCKTVHTLEWSGHPLGRDAARVMERLCNISALVLDDCSLLPGEAESLGKTRLLVLKGVEFKRMTVDANLIAHLPEAWMLRWYGFTDCSIHDSAAGAILERLPEVQGVTFSRCKVGPRTLDLLSNARVELSRVTVDPALADSSELSRAKPEMAPPR